jgi:DNA-directed RNA polymerase specialized sigma24 family protein
MPEAMQMTRSTLYASRADFRRIFDEDMSGLYLLSLLLTADREKAEQCFVSGLEDAVEGNPVFKEWARSWARRAIIQNAVRVIHTRPVEGGSRLSPASVNGNGKTPPAEQQVEIAAVLALEPFARFVYVMTVLERYSDQECSVLLGCARRDILTARTRAFQQIGSAMELHYGQMPNASSQNLALHESCTSVLDLLVAPRLATSA